AWPCFRCRWFWCRRPAEQSRRWLVSPDHVGTRGGPVRDDVDDLVPVVAPQVRGDALVEWLRVGEVERDQGEVALGNVHRVGARVAVPDDPGLGARAACGGAGGQDDVPRARPALPLAA